MDYLIGDTIRLKASIKNLAGVASAPADYPTVSVYDMDETALLSSGTSSTGSSVGEYYYDWDTSSEVLGQYKAKIKATFGSYPQVDTKFLELVEVKDE